LENSASFFITLLGCSCRFLLAQKQQLVERLEEGPGPNERAEIERLLVEINEELSLLGEAGPGTSNRDEE
jgi:hypothetical protein